MKEVRAVILGGLVGVGLAFVSPGCALHRARVVDPEKMPCEDPQLRRLDQMNQSERRQPIGNADDCDGRNRPRKK